MKYLHVRQSKTKPSLFKTFCDLFLILKIGYDLATKVCRFMAF